MAETRTSGLLHRDLEVVSISRERWATTLADSGLPLPTAQSLAELYAASEDGLLAPRGDRTLVMDTALKTTLAGLPATSVH